MATERIKSIGAGKDYATPALWHAGEIADLVALDEVRIGEMYDSFLSASGIAISNSWVTDQTRYFHLRAHSSKLHLGVVGAGIVIKHTTANGILLSDGNTVGKSFKVSDFEVDTTRLASLTYGGTVYSDFSNMIAHGQTDANRSIHAYSRYGFVKNCLFYGMVSNIYTDFSANFKFVNCTIHNANSGAGANGGIIFSNYQRTLVKNCAILANGVKDISHHTRTAPGTYPKNNCSSDDSCQYHTNALYNKTAANQFNNIAGNDFSVKLGADLISAGIGSGSDSEIPTTDIAGKPRSSTAPTIGCFEYIPSVWFLLNRKNQLAYPNQF